MSEKPRTAADDLREATREANAAIKDLRAVLREVAAAERSIRGAAQEEVEVRIDEEVSDQLNELLAVAVKEMDRASGSVIAKFDELEKWLLHGRGLLRGPDLVEVAVKHVVLREPYQLIREAGDQGDPRAFLRDMNAAAQAR